MATPGFLKSGAAIFLAIGCISGRASAFHKERRGLGGQNSASNKNSNLFSRQMQGLLSRTITTI